MGKIGVLRNRTVTEDGFVEWDAVDVCECENRSGPAGGLCVNCGDAIETNLQADAIAALQAERNGE